MCNIKLTIEYDGTNYCGWQKQKNGLSVQDLIEKVLKRILHERIKLIGASRTDSGVHAKGQVANFKTFSRLSLKKVKDALNGSLPKDISIVKADIVNKRFNAQFSAKSKIYKYLIFNRKEHYPFYNKYSIHIPRKLDIGAIKKGARSFLGKHDFSSFRGSKCVTKTSTRTIKRLSVKKHNNFIIINIEADGFLYNMARNIVGTLIEVGGGKLKPGDIRKILSARNRRLAGYTAPAKGLSLAKILYE